MLVQHRHKSHARSQGGWGRFLKHALGGGGDHDHTCDGGDDHDHTCDGSDDHDHACECGDDHEHGKIYMFLIHIHCYICLHMGQFLQDGENVCLTSFFS